NGQVTINGTIDASGSAPSGAAAAGGTVNIYAQNAITLGATGKILATTTPATATTPSPGDQRGGDIVLGIAANAAGVIDLRQGSAIDVSGGAAGGLSGGTLRLRAPLIAGTNDLAIGSIASNISGARSLVVEDYLAISTDNAVGQAVGFKGVIDPA